MRTHYEQHFRGLFCLEVEWAMVPVFSLLGNRDVEARLTQCFDATIAAMGPASETWLVTAEAIQLFEQSPAEPVRNLWRVHVHDHYDLAPVQRPGLQGVILRRRL